jgi:glycosyltransferase involved in cell wall biosynthesis/cellulose synthase/poly-beta-1,6-N-acetylglucosamine synthase-like glycosyltransferase
MDLDTSEHRGSTRGLPRRSPTDASPGTPRVIVAYTACPWETAVPILRILGPAQQAGLQVIRGNGEGSPVASLEAVPTADVVLIQRDFPRYTEMYEKIVACAHAEGKPIVYELDDLLLDLPQTHPDSETLYYRPALIPMMRAIAEADVVTASTPPLCAYLRSFNPNTWLLPNYLDDRLWRFRDRARKSTCRPVVVGYMGTGSHVPDLEYVTSALLHIADRYGDDVRLRFWTEKLPENLQHSRNVEWTPLRLDKYAEFVSYFSTQDCDIAISPLCDNLFNQCKSPIKFLEYSTLGVPGVYSRVAPYEGVITHGENGFLASSTDEWIEYVSQLIELSSLRHRMGISAQQTVRQQWLLSQHAHEWLAVYQQAVNMADQRRGSNEVAVRVIQQVQRWQQTSEAAGEAEQTVQQREPDRTVTALQAQVVEKERTIQALTARLATITGSSGWALLHVLWAIRLRLVPSGSRREWALLLGIGALRVWRQEGLGVLARRSGHWLRRWADRTLRSHSRARSAPTHWYEAWILGNEPTEAQLAEQRLSAEEMASTPLISILTPVHNPAPEILDGTIQSVVDQTYGHWELCLIDGHSTRPGVKRVLEEWADRDARIHVEFLDRNLGISGNSNEALDMARGEFVALLDHDDLLAPFALFEVARFLGANPDCDMVYSDEDKVDPDGRRHTPFFKPDWSPDLLQAFMYTGHLTVYRRDLVQSLGGFRPEFDYSQDYDLALRVTETTDRIGHIPKVLYHWQVVPGSVSWGGKPFARASNIAALESAVDRRGYDAEVMEYPTANRIRFRLQEHPLVSIIIPTDREGNILPGLASLLQKIRYPRLEVVVVTNTGLAARIDEVYAIDSRVRTVRFDAPFNFSAKCNRGAEEAKGEYLLFLNDDVEPLDEDWIECMLGYFQQDGVGAVSPKLLYPNGLVQHAGLVTGVRGFVGTAFHTQHSDSTIHFNLLQSTRTVSALSAACMLIPKDLFGSLGGFDEVHTPIMHSDLDLCFKIREKGLRLVYTPFTSLRHTGHASLAEAERAGYRHSDKAGLYLLQRWGKYLSYDPYYTDNMRDLLYRDSPVRYRMYADNCSDSVSSKGDLLFVSHDLSLSGAPIILHALAKYLRRIGYSVTLVSPLSGGLLDTCRQESMPVIIDPLIYDSPDDLESLLRNYDVIVANTVLSWPLVNSAKLLGKPVIWLIHEGDAGRRLAGSNTDVQKALAMADLVVFPSRQTKEMYHQFAVRDNHVVLHYGLEVPDPPDEGTVSSRPDRFHVVQVASVEPRKGQDVLVKCISSLPSELRGAFEFSFVGRVLIDDYYRQVRRETARLKNVDWVGEVSHREALRCISDADVVVCTSRDDPSPLVVLEAMAYGKAIISTNVGAMPEVIEHEVSGLIVDVEDHLALARGLIRLYRDRKFLLQIGDAARNTFRRHLTLERYGNDIAEMIQRVTPQRLH